MKTILATLAAILTVAGCATATPAGPSVPCDKPGIAILIDAGAFDIKATGRIILAPGEPPAILTPCETEIVAAAVAYWDRVLANDARTVSLTVVEAGEPYVTSAYGSGSGPTDAPHGTLGIGREYPGLKSAPNFYGVIRHEIAHALGIGSGSAWWSRIRNLAEPEMVSPPDTYFAGPSAHRAFLQLGGGDYYEGPGVPVANGEPAPVQRNTHWRTGFIDHEIMVGCSERHPCDALYAPASPITLAALADMGWIVDMGMAEPGARVGDFRHFRP